MDVGQRNAERKNKTKGQKNMEKYITANCITGLDIEKLEGTEEIYTDIEDFIYDLGREFDGTIAIAYIEEHKKAIEEAGFSF